MDELTKKEPGAPQSEDAYRSIRGYVIEAQRQVYTAVNDFRGWLGEGSTEISGGEDLHPEAVAGIDLTTAAPKVTVRSSGSELIVFSSRETELRIVDARGRTVMVRNIAAGESRIDISALQHGIYLAICPKVVKFVV